MPVNDHDSFNFTDIMNRLTEIQNNSSGTTAINRSFLPKMNQWHPKFGGNDDCSLSHVIQKWEDLASNCQMTNATLLSQVHLLLKDDAIKWHNAIGADIRNWDAYKAALINRFQPPDRVVATFMSVANIQKPNEKFDDYYARLRMLMKQAQGEIVDKQLVTRLQTGLKDTRCRDVVRNNYSAIGGADWSKIVQNINQIETEYDLIEKERANAKSTSDKLRETTQAIKSLYPPSPSWLNPSKFNKKPSYFNKLNVKTEQSSKIEPSKFGNLNIESPLTQKALNTKSESNASVKNPRFTKNLEKAKEFKSHRPLLSMEHIDEHENIKFIEPSEELMNEIDDNRATLSAMFIENEWNESDIKSYMESQTCSNCDNDGHILEYCPVLEEHKLFKLQCLYCHAPNITSDECPECSKN